MEHTELPELVVGYMDQGHGHGHYAVLRKESGELFANVPFGDKNLATQVVRACNAFPELLTIIEDVIRETDKKGMFANALMVDRAKTVFAKATGKE